VANANLRKSADSGNIGKMNSAMKTTEKAAGALEKKKQEMLTKANATGATADQVQAEWIRWLDEIKKEVAKKP
jgi:transcriptional regulator